MFAVPAPGKTLQDNLGNEISDIAAFVPPKPHNCTAKKKQGPKFKKSVNSIFLLKNESFDTDIVILLVSTLAEGQQMM